MYLANRAGGWSTTAIGRFYNGRDHSTVWYSIQRIKALREINYEVDELVAGLEKALQDPESALIQSPSIKQPTSIKLDKLREDILLDKLADRIASRLVLVLRGVGVSDRRFRPAADPVAQTDHSPDIAT